MDPAPAMSGSRRPGVTHRSEISFDEPQRLLGVDTATDHQGGIGRSVPPVVEGDDVVQAGGVQIMLRSDGGVAVGLVGVILACQHGVEQVAVGAVVVALPLLLLDDVTLGGEALLGDGQVRHALGLQPQTQLQRSGWHQLEVVRPIEARRGIGRPADRLDRCQMFT